MADLVIQGMEMPKYTTKAEFGIDADGNPLCMVYHEDGTEPDIYDVVPLPEGHGRLGDLDALDKFLHEKENDADAEEIYLDEAWYNTFRQILRVTQTIVPAEGGVEE